MQGANEFLAALVQRVDSCGLRSFGSDLVSFLFSGKYRRPYVQRMLVRLRKRGFLRATRTARWLNRGFRRGFVNIYAVTKRGRERARWWLLSHDLTSIAYLASTPVQGREFASAGVALTGSSLPAPWSRGGFYGFKFRAPDRNSLGLLLSALSGNFAYSLTFRGLDVWWWLEALKAEGVIPRDLASLSWVVAAKGLFGATDEQILIATLYKSAHLQKARGDALAETLTKNIQQQKETETWNKLLQAQSESSYERRLREQRETYERALRQQTSRCPDIVQLAAIIVQGDLETQRHIMENHLKIQRNLYNFTNRTLRG